jgi:hypothetical protein
MAGWGNVEIICIKSVAKIRTNDPGCCEIDLILEMGVLPKLSV